MNKFKKKTRSKVIAASIAILSSAAVVSTGFAAWVISGGDSKEATGAITAETVSDASHTLSAVTWDDKKGEIIFGAPEKHTGGTFLNSDGKVREKLVATGTFTVSNLTDGWTIDGLFNTSVLKVTEKTDVYPKGGEYVCEPPSYIEGQANSKIPGVYVEVGTDTAVGTATTTGNFKLSVVFGWGSKTENQNPFTFYEKKGNNATNRSQAKAVIDEVLKLNGCSFSITIETKAQ